MLYSISYSILGCTILIHHRVVLMSILLFRRLNSCHIIRSFHIVSCWISKSLRFLNALFKSTLGISFYSTLIFDSLLINLLASLISSLKTLRFSSLTLFIFFQSHLLLGINIQELLGLIRIGLGQNYSSIICWTLDTLQGVYLSWV